MRFFLVSALPATALVWLGVGLYLNQSHESAIASAGQETRNLAHAFEENIRRSVQSIDITLGVIRAARAQSPGNFDIAAFEKASGLTRDLTLQLAITDRTGLVMSSNLGTPTPGATIADRPHFLGPKRDPLDEMFISVPVVGRVSGKSSVQFVRKLYTPAHEFDGVIVASLDPAFLSRFYQSLTMDGGALLLAGQDGVLRAVAPDNLAPLGSDIHALALDDMLRTPGGTLMNPSTTLRQGFIFSWRRVEPYGLIVAVGKARKDVLRPFHRDMQLWTLIGLGLTGLISALSVAVARGRRQVVRSQAVLRAAVDNISQGLLVVDRTRMVRIINARALEILDLPDRFGRGPVGFDDILAYQEQSGEFNGPEQDEVRALVETGGLAAGSSVYQRRRRNGTMLEFRTKMLSSGLAVRTITDITDLQNTADVLSRARDDAEQAARRRSEFLTVMSHEIRTPLNGVIGVVHLLEELELGLQQRDYVRLIRESGDHLLHLVNDILDFSRLEASRVELEQVVFSPARLVDDVEALFASQAAAKGLHLGQDLGSDVPAAVVGDPGRLRQILLNLVGNAIKFTDKGRVWVSLTARPGHDDQVELCFSVADSGIGIVPEALATIFQDFVQMDGSISRRFGGSGLGLAICRRLVAMMGGQISVDSQVGDGSIFTFTVCCNRAEQAAQAAPALDAPPPATPLRSLHLLVAEDNATNQVVIRRQLERLGHVATVVDTGAAALSAVASETFNLVLMDVMMPEMDGLTATRRIRAAGAPWATIPILGLTAGSRPEELAQCRAAGMDEIATKPITMDQLAETLTRMMNVVDGPVAGTRNAPVSAAPAGSPPEAPLPSRDENMLDRLRAELGAEATKEVVDAFREESRQRIVQMGAAAARADRSALRVAAHSMRGAAHGLGAGQLARLSAELEDGLALWTAGKIEAAIGAIDVELSHIEATV